MTTSGLKSRARRLPYAFNDVSADSYAFLLGSRDNDHRSLRFSCVRFVESLQYGLRPTGLSAPRSRALAERVLRRFHHRADSLRQFHGQVLDRLRAISHAALIVEAHSPHSDGPNGHMLRPFGASLWRRWPDFGICLLPENMPADASEDERYVAAQMRESKLAPWRGARAKRDFPRKLRVGATLPWEVYG